MLSKIFQHGIFICYVTDLIFFEISAQSFAQQELRKSTVPTSLNYMYFQVVSLFLLHLKLLALLIWNCFLHTNVFIIW